MNKREFCVFILTHGRADSVITYNTLKKCGYDGDVFIVIDNEDKTADRYRENFGDKVIMFDKEEVSKTFDQADNFDDRRAIVYARNVCFELAEQLGYEWFIQLDDDYTRFSNSVDENLEYTTKQKIIDFNKVVESYIKFMKTNENVSSIAFAQGGDFIGGAKSGLMKDMIKRKAMNSFICSTKRKFQFIGRINEDVNTYTRMGSIGQLFFTIPHVRLEQKQTQTNSGGMTDIYKLNGTYIKSFYTIIFQPSSVKIRTMGVSERRLHHSINWKCTVPKILNENLKKR